MHELRGAPEPPLAELLGKLAQVDLVLIEGFKRDAHPKLEVHRAANGKPLLYPDDMQIKALVSDLADTDVPEHLARASIDDVEAVAALVLRLAAVWR